MTTGKDTAASRSKSLIDGMKKHFSNASAPLAFEGSTFTPAQLASAFQTLIDLRAAVDDAQAVAKAKVAIEATQAPPLRRLQSAFVAFVKVTFGNSPDVLADFGLKPRKATTPLTVDEKATAAAKRAATRAARNTMGSRQKKKVKGTVVSPTPSTASTPVVAPSHVASAPAQPAGGASAVAASPRTP